MIVLRDSKVKTVTIEYEDGDRDQWYHCDAASIEMILRYAISPQKIGFGFAFTPPPVPKFVDLNCDVSLKDMESTPITVNITPQERVMFKYLPEPYYIDYPTIVRDKLNEHYNAHNAFIIDLLPSISMGYCTKMEDSQDDFESAPYTVSNATIKTETKSVVGSYVMDHDCTEIMLKKLEEFGFKKRSSAYGTVYYEGDSGKLAVLKIHGIFLKEYVPTP